MKTKKFLILLSAILIFTLLFASCGVDRKCPAYTKADTPAQETVG